MLPKYVYVSSKNCEYEQYLPDNLISSKKIFKKYHAIIDIQFTSVKSSCIMN